MPPLLQPKYAQAYKGEQNNLPYASRRTRCRTLALKAVHLVLGSAAGAAAGAGKRAAGRLDCLGPVRCALVAAVRPRRCLTRAAWRPSARRAKIWRPWAVGVPRHGAAKLRAFKLAMEPHLEQTQALLLW